MNKEKNTPSGSCFLRNGIVGIEIFLKRYFKIKDIKLEERGRIYTCIKKVFQKKVYQVYHPSYLLRRVLELLKIKYHPKKRVVYFCKKWYTFFSPDKKLINLLLKIEV